MATEQLSEVDAVIVSTILEDFLDQLVIMGRILPASLEHRSNAEDIVKGEIGSLISNQMFLQTKYEKLMQRRDELLRGSGGVGGDTQQRVNPQMLASISADIENVDGSIKAGMRQFARSVKQSPLTADNMQKIQQDRTFLEDVIGATIKEILKTQTCENLVAAVKEEQEQKNMLQKTIQKEEEGRKRVRQLQKKLQEMKRERETEIQQRNEMIAHLKDQLQEMKAKTSMENRYVKKMADVTVAQTQRRCQLTEKELKEEIEKLKTKIDEETRVNMEIESFLRTHQEKLERKVELWMEKYDKDLAAKQRELDVLKASKASDLARLQELTRKYAEYEAVVVEDRIEKEKARRKAEQEAREMSATVRIQSWWRGVMVRKGLGSYSKKKKKGKGKKGKKSAKRR